MMKKNQFQLNNNNNKIKTIKLNKIKNKIQREIIINIQVEIIKIKRTGIEKEEDLGQHQRIVKILMTQGLKKNIKKKDLNRDLDQNLKKKS